MKKLTKLANSLRYAFNKNDDVFALMKRGYYVAKNEGLDGIKHRVNVFHNNDQYERGVFGAYSDISSPYKESYRTRFELANKNKSEYIEEWKSRNFDYETKLIAFYLPQFHCFPENDEWWGKGFTEWRNATKACPQFVGHEQPLLPSDLGFYDLENKNILPQQAELAKNYGLHGFCFHYYWFSGKKLMELPIKQFYENKSIDLNFSICWANENWTRRWDGNEEDVLIGQNHSVEIDSNFINDVADYLRDPRYIKVDGKLLLTVYRPAVIPDIKTVVNNWRKYCKDNNIGELHLVMAKSFEQTDPSEYGFDAAVEFPPHQLGEIVAPESPSSYEMLNHSFSGLIFDYNKVVDAKAKQYHEDKTTDLYRTVFPSWDNEARKPGRGHVFTGSTPSKYQTWLENAIEYSLNNKVNDESVVFINAWNEWAEGAVLEPSINFGHNYLKATQQSLERSKVHELCISKNEAFLKKESKRENLVVLHLYYDDLFEELFEKISNISDADVIINFGNDITYLRAEKILNSFGNVAGFVFENRGRDILPLFEVMEFVENLPYKRVIKIHSKKSKHRIDGEQWRQQLVNSIIGSPDVVSKNFSLLDNGAKLVAPTGHLFNSLDYFGSNESHMSRLTELKSSELARVNYKFPAGSMYIADFKSLKEFCHKVNDLDLDFEQELGQVDGTLAHALERYLGYYFENNALKMVES
ncbi:glycoside hydrolase family 99-like domain-containing protein [Vibrio echinoideorum]|uniref:glycoside hydrolase family 99-like domain-containing protein n=1 Tax=Vibrio echinoideorum TaxID=2100116 RepID=UPI001081F834|nr:glycoside hydrolase family 99-like domain-containing protein [Vibrio echinoideorum]